MSPSLFSAGFVNLKRWPKSGKTRLVILGEGLPIWKNSQFVVVVQFRAKYKEMKHVTLGGGVFFC